MLGWMFSRYKDREQEKFKGRLLRREDLVKSFLNVHQMIIQAQGKVSDGEFTPAWIKLCGLMHLYGSEEENKCLKEFADNYLGQNANVEGANRKLNALKTKLITSVRSELGFK